MINARVLDLVNTVWDKLLNKLNKREIDFKGNYEKTVWKNWMNFCAYKVRKYNVRADFFCK